MSGHDHHHHHHHSTLRRNVPAAMPHSLLRMSVGERLVYALFVIAAIWAGVFWAVS